MAKSVRPVLGVVLILSLALGLTPLERVRATVLEQRGAQELRPQGSASYEIDEFQGVALLKGDSGLLELRRGDQIQPLGVSVIAARLIDPSTVAYIDQSLAIRLLDLRQGVETTLVPSGGADGPLFVSPDRVRLAYLQPSDFQGDSRFAKTHSIAVVDLRTKAVSVLLTVHRVTLRLFGWASPNNVLIEVPTWSSALVPVLEIHLGTLSLGQRLNTGEDPQVQIPVVATWPAILPGASIATTSFDQRWLTYQDDAGVIVASLDDFTYSRIEGVSDPAWRVDGLQVTDTSGTRMVAPVALARTAARPAQAFVSIPETVVSVEALAFAASNDLALGTDKLYRPVKAGVPVSAYFDLNPVAKAWRDFRGYTGTAFVYGRSYDEHRGTDFDADPGEDVFASQVGKVVEIRPMCENTYGKEATSGALGTYIEIDHGRLSDGNTYRTQYAHLLCGAKDILVTKGATISSLPTHIGEMGNSGNSSGPHTHLTVFRNGVQVDPYHLGIISDSPPAKASLTSPAPGTTLTGGSVYFQWNQGSGVTSYFLYVGNSVGTHDIFGNGVSNNGQTVTGLPTDGRTLHVRLWSMIGGQWAWTDYTYKAATIVAAVKAQMTSPTSGSKLTGATAHFTWNNGIGVSSHFLYVGTSAGAYNLFNNSVSGGSQTVTGLPMTGQTLYVRLWSLISGTWQWVDYTYTAASAASTVKAQITTPVSGSTLTSSTTSFSFNNGTGVSAYFLYVGTSSGANNIFGGYVSGGSQSVSGLPTNGQTVYVRLYSLIAGAWQHNDYTYKATTVLGGTRAQITGPSTGSTFESSSATFTWNSGVSVSSYYLYVGTSVGANNLFNGYVTGGFQTVTGLPTNGQTIHVRLHSLIAGAWQHHDYTYTAVTASSSAKAQLLSPQSGSTFSSSAVPFTWSNGSGVAAHFLYVGTSFGDHDLFNSYVTSGFQTVTGIPTGGQAIYVRLWSMINNTWEYNDYSFTATGTSLRGKITSPVSGSTLTSSTTAFQWSNGSAATTYFLHVGSAFGSSNLFHGYVSGGSQTVSGLPTNGQTVYVRLWSLINGVWQANDYTYTAARSGTTVQHLYLPADRRVVLKKEVIGRLSVRSFVEWSISLRSGGSQVRALSTAPFDPPASRLRRTKHGGRDAH